VISPGFRFALDCEPIVRWGFVPWSRRRTARAFERDGWPVIEHRTMVDTAFLTNA